ncbi:MULTISPECIES: hypothetical protein [unclassified Spirosoma]|uniref:hypothetical protein n=1 Tax=unclassified Spirosoma TaxID=2621999 RepID=UPI0009659A1D|nr:MULTISPECIES: hypothetical protein [unclassified Spirosoma]MBN8821760.1 hypothetical protein [Spirosoma sp.]OJW80748.1 MAG: hypothetical protein BGO59_35390 [Spirosoma sp. 48-14]
MKTKWLFPHSYRLIGWLIFVPSATLGLAALYADFNIFSLVGALFNKKELAQEKNYSLSAFFNSDNMTDEVGAIGVIIGLLLIAFSREKTEDEMISQLRLESLQWSVYANYIILAIAILLFYDGAFFNVMIYNMFTVLLVFIIRFRWLMSGSTIVRYEKSTES